ncbi:MAG: ABC transporter ATP-binding protein [Planctomycetes bacterium]|nr:ABC transporter ATP-binding protein [Planctomycetota bacterium]
MTADVVVAVRGVAKKFARSLKRSFVYGARDIGRLLLRRPVVDALRASEFWAVREVSFELRRGRSIGIIGQNGSGKTTLLRMICGILRPDLGEVAVAGRIAPMLALGAGFKPVLSGRQNVFLNLALLGVSERDARSRYDAIVDFAELHDAIDAPLGTYSSGMQARLGFACAVHTEPSILVVDEVLSVGDAKFRGKCRNKINDLRRGGTSLLLVSHSPVLIETLSDECLYLRGGKMAGFGAAADVLKQYEADSIQQAAAANEARLAALQQRDLAPGQRAAVRSVRLQSGGKDVEHWFCGRPGEVVIALQAAAPTEPISVNVMIFDLVHQAGETVQMLVSSRDHGWLALPGGDCEVRLGLPQVGLRPGSYRLKLSVSRGALHDILDVVDDVRLVVRDGGGSEHCAFFQPRVWSSDRAGVCGRHVPVAADEPDPAGADEG